jgi:hypothetical protein
MVLEGDRRGQVEEESGKGEKRSTELVKREIVHSKER